MKGRPARLPIAGGMMPSYLAGSTGMYLTRTDSQRSTRLRIARCGTVEAIPDAVRRPQAILRAIFEIS